MTTRRLTLLAASGAIVAAGITGCAQQAGTENKTFDGEANRVANVIRDLDDAYADEQNDDDGATTACRTLLSKRLVDAFGGTRECAKNAAVALDNADTTEMDVREVTIQGAVATAKVRLRLNDDEERIDTLKLVQEGRSWKFDGSTKGQKAPEND